MNVCIPLILSSHFNLGKVVAADDKDNPLLAALIAVSVVAVVVIAVLSAVLARFVYLYIRRRRHTFGNGTYTKYETGGK